MQEVTSGGHLKGRAEIHWAEVKGDHPERKNNKKESVKMEGKVWQLRVVCFICVVGACRCTALSVGLRSSEKVDNEQPVVVSKEDKRHEA